VNGVISLTFARNFKKTIIQNMKTIKVRIIVYFSILFILSLSIFGFIDFKNFSSTLLTENINYTSAIASQFTINLDTYLKEAETSLKVLAANDTVISGIKYYNTNSEYTNKKNHDSLNNMVNDIVAQKPDISNIIIYFNGMEFGFNRNLGDIINWDFLKNVEESYKSVDTADIRFFKNYIAMSPGDKDISSRISICLPIRDLKSLSKINLGYAFFDFNMKRIDEMFKSSGLNQNSIALISNGSGNIIYSSNTGFFNNKFDWGLLREVYKNHSGTFTQKIGRKSMLVTYSTSGINGWKVVFIIDMSGLDKNLNNTEFFTIFLIIISVIITVFISLIISVSSTTPLVRLVKQMRLVENGNLSIRIDETARSYDEINTLNRGFNSMMDRINQLIKDVYQEKLKQREAEFEALQATINPHFLYNTLQTINSLAVLERTNDIEHVATSLGNLLEYLVYEQNEMVKVYREIDYIKSYLEIQNYRFNNSIKVFIDISQDVYSCYVLKLLLQPLVENALLHGLDKKREKGIIRISGIKDGNNVIFEIEDNGAGIESAKLEQIMSKLAISVNSNTKKSIGLMNVQERIKIKFGEEYGIKISSVVNEGTVVKVFIPAIEAKKGESTDD
jgi:two-component system, sensor histidine kinase YesM